MAAEKDEKRKYQFKAEIKKLLDILSKSLYQHKEIFLRELISNAVDALKKIHFVSLTNNDIEDSGIEEKITITIDPEINTLTIGDTGVGMTRDELVNNLGTIAGSGTEKFIRKLQEQQEKGDEERLDMDIIGQLGVGFSSVFMVSEKVDVITKSYLKGEMPYKWTSDGTGNFTIESVEKSTRGTDIVVHLAEGEDEYLSSHRIESIIKKYSNFVPFPIYVNEIQEEEEEEEEEEDKKVVDVEETEEGEEVVSEEEEEEEPQPVNETTPLWKKNIDDISEEDYKDFYHYISNRYDNYLNVINYRIEGKVRFNSILFIPENAGRELMEPDVDYGLALYSKNVMIMENCRDLIPKWLRFVKGVLESEDIPLNISRETIQSDRRIMKMNKLVTKKIIRELKKMAKKEEEKYNQFWEQFSSFIKEGIVTDHQTGDKLKDLLRFKTSKTSEGDMIGLKEYVKNMKEDQDEIYYLVGESLDTLKLSPHLGYYNKEDLEVILFDNPIDNFLMMNLHEYKTRVKVEEEYQDKAFKFTPIDVTEEEEVKDEEAEEEEEKEEDKVPGKTRDFLQKVKEILGSKIIDAKITDKLYGNACRLANPAGGMSSSQQRAMRFWTQQQMGQEFQIPKKIIEFNPNHPLVKDLIQRTQKDPDNGKIRPTIIQMFENCLLAEGDLPDPTKMVPRINQILEMLITGKEDVKNILEEQQKKLDEENKQEGQEEEKKKSNKQDEEENSEED